MAMNKSLSFSSLMILLVVGFAVSFNPTLAEDEIDWKVCGRGLTTKCGQIISSKVNLNEGPLPDGRCCRQLVKIGKPCHDAFTQAHLQSKDFEGTLAQLTERSDEVWTECVSIANLMADLAPAPAPAPPVDSPDYTAPAEAPGVLDIPEDV